MPKRDEWRQQLDERQQARQADEEHQRERRQELRDAYAVLVELVAASPRGRSDAPVEGVP
jgi:hypothetical protein